MLISLGFLSAKMRALRVLLPQVPKSLRGKIPGNPHCQKKQLLSPEFVNSPETIGSSQSQSVKCYLQTYTQVIVGAKNKSFIKYGLIFMF